MTGQLTTEERLDLAAAVGLATEIRQVGDLVTASMKDADMTAESRTRLDQLLAEQAEVTRRIAAVVKRHATEIRERLDGSANASTSVAQDDRNRQIAAALEVLAQVDATTGGDIGKFADLIADRVSTRVAHARSRLMERE